MVASRQTFWTDYEVPFLGYDIDGQKMRFVNSYPVTSWCRGQGRAGGRSVRDYILTRIKSLSSQYIFPNRWAINTFPNADDIIEAVAFSTSKRGQFLTLIQFLELVHRY